MVEQITACFKYLPVEPVGFSFVTVTITARKLSNNLDDEKLTFPNGRFTKPYLSALNSISPFIAFDTALSTSSVTVPIFGFGINPLGPKMRATRPTSGIMSGVAMHRLKRIVPSCISFNRSSAPTISAPAAFALSAASP